MRKKQDQTYVPCISSVRKVLSILDRKKQTTSISSISCKFYWLNFGTDIKSRSVRTEEKGFIVILINV